MDALENGAASFSTLYNDLSRRVRKNKQMETNLARQKEQVDALNTQADRKYKQAEEKLHEAQRLEAELRESRKDAEAMQRRLQERIEQVQQSERTLLAKEKSFQSEQRKMTLQTNLTLSNMKSTTEAQLASMREKMEEALIKSEEARKESLAHRNKSCSLADQLKVLQERIKTRKAPAHPSASDAKRSETAILERRIKALEATNKVQAQQLKEAGIATPQRRIARGNSTAIPKSFVDLTRSSSPIGNDGLDSPATPLDGCMFATQASASSAQEGSSPTAQRKGKKRSRASLSVEPERLDDEMDEALFPMPGFGGRNPALPTRGNSVYVRFDSNESTHVTASRHATSSSTATNAASSLTSASSSVRPTVDCKSPSQTKKRKARVSAPSDSSSSSSSSSSNSQVSLADSLVRTVYHNGHRNRQPACLLRQPSRRQQTVLFPRLPPPLPNLKSSPPRRNARRPRATSRHPCPRIRV